MLRIASDGRAKSDGALLSWPVSMNEYICLVDCIINEVNQTISKLEPGETSSITMRSALKLALVLSVSLAAVGVQLITANVFSKSTAGDLDALCRGDSIDLRTISHLEKLVKTPTTSGDNCQPRIREALEEMWRIAENSKACTMEKAEGIAKFAEKFLKSQADENGQEQPKLPEPLVKFAVAYGMQVSFICGRHMMYEFAPFAYNRLVRRFDMGEKNERPFAKFFVYLTDNSPLSLLLSPLSKPGEVLLPSDLLQVVPDLDKKMGEFLSNSKALKNLKDFCSENLEPLYKPILMPIAILNRAGFNYKNFAFKRDMFVANILSSFEREGRFWSSVVFLCESAKMIKIVDDQDQAERDKSEAEESQLIKVFSESEMQWKIKPDHIPNEQFENPVEPYVPQEIVGNKILGHCDFTLKSKVKSYDANKDEIQRLRERILDRSYEIFSLMSQKGTHWPAMKKFFKRLALRKGTDEEYQVAVQGLHDLMDKAAKGSVVYGFKMVGQIALTGIPILIAYVLLFLGIAFTSLFTFHKRKHFRKFGFYPCAIPNQN